MVRNDEKRKCIFFSVGAIAGRLRQSTGATITNYKGDQSVEASSVNTSADETEPVTSANAGLGSNDSTVLPGQGEPRANAKPVKVCKAYAPTGSRIGKRVCRTQAAWDEIERVAQNRLDSSTKPQSNNRKERGQ